MMSDREISEAIRDLTTLTLSDGIEWTRSTDSRSFETSDLAGFTVQLTLDASSDVSLRIEDADGPVALVAMTDGRTEADRARIMGTAFELLTLVRQRAGSSEKARWDAAVVKRKD